MKRPVPLLVLAFFVASCKNRPGTVVTRAGEPDVVSVGAEDPVMNAAIRNAASTLPSFKAVLATPPAGASGFAVKVAFSFGSNDKEHIWLTAPAFSNGSVSGVVNNEPVNVTTIKIGQQVSAPETQVSDWMYVQEGVLRGGFTIRVLLNRMHPAERESQVKAMGIRLE